MTRSHLGNTQVANFQVALQRQQQITRFEIFVNDTHAVQILQPVDQLREVIVRLKKRKLFVRR